VIATYRHFAIAIAPLGFSRSSESTDTIGTGYRLPFDPAFPVLIPSNPFAAPVSEAR